MVTSWGIRVMKRLSSFLAAIAFVASFVMGAVAPTVSAQGGQNWLNTSALPSLDAISTVPQSVFAESNNLTYANECQNMTMVTRPARPGQSQLTINRCWYSNAMGLFVPDGGTGAYAVSGGGSMAGLINGRALNSRIWPTPNPEILLDTKVETSSDYTKFHYRPRLNTTSFSNGAVSHTFSAYETFTLMNEAGAVFTGRPLHLNYSDNGVYSTMVLNGSMIRINLATKRILSFGAPAPLGPGHNPDTQVSITNDGNYAVATVTSPNDGNRWMRVYDLAACQGAETTFIKNVHAGCPYRDFKTFLETHIPAYKNVTMAKFVDNETLTFFHYDATNPGGLYTQFVMREPGTSAGEIKYMALGDSFASGEGAGDYERGTDAGDANRCHLSKRSYPYLLRSELNPTSFHSVACSGARIVNIGGSANSIRTGDSYSTNDPFQVNQYDPDDMPESDLGAFWMPGYQPQISFVKDIADVKSNVITLSVVGNDIGFKDKVERCVGPGTCFETYEDRYEIAKEINSRFYSLTRLFENVRAGAPPDGKVYVLGYPEIAYPEGADTNSCRANVHLNKDELKFANDLVSYLNDMIQLAAEKAGVRYIDIQDAFVGHRFCESDNVAINGATIGNDFLVIGGNESYHPNLLGHQLLKNAIMTRSTGFTQVMPTPNPSITKPEVQDTIAMLANAPRSNRQMNESNYDSSISSDVVYRSSIWDSAINFLSYMIVPNSLYRAVINSEPVELGTFNSGEDGTLNISAQIPASIPTGAHTLHIYGRNMDGQNIDINKTIYVAESPTDFDGDGVPNSEEECLGVEPANVDEDNDGIDDACDGEITVQADTVAPTVTGAPDRSPDNGDWYDHDVTINWTATDPEPSSGAPTQPAATLADQEGVQTYTSAESCDPEGNCATGSLEVKLDKTAPSIDFSLSPTPSSGGWNNTDVAVTFNCNDATSGIASCTEPITISDPDGGYIVTGTATDNAGNTTSVSAMVMIDRTAPTVTNAVSPAPNASGWNNTDVTVTPECSDSLSGIFSCTQASVLSGEGANQIVNSTATDNAGNTAGASTAVNIDKSAPLLGTPAWTNNPKSTADSSTLTVPATDNLAGVEEAEYFLGDEDPGQGNGATMTLDGGNLTTTFGTDFPTGVYKVTVRAKDVAGNWSEPVSDYLVVYNPDGVRMTGWRTLLPSVSEGDVLPGLISPSQDDRARFGFNVRYNNLGQIHQNSDFQFSYHTGTQCFNPLKAQNCHLLYMNATSVEWLATQGTNNSTGIFQGAAWLLVDGQTRQVTFRLTGLDGERLNDSSADHLTLRVFAQGDNPNTATPLYHVDADVVRGNVRVNP